MDKKKLSPAQEYILKQEHVRKEGVSEDELDELLRPDTSIFSGIVNWVKRSKMRSIGITAQEGAKLRQDIQEAKVAKGVIEDDDALDFHINHGVFVGKRKITRVEEVKDAKHQAELAKYDKKCRQYNGVHAEKIDDHMAKLQEILKEEDAQEWLNLQRAKRKLDHRQSGFAELEQKASDSIVEKLRQYGVHEEDIKKCWSAQFRDFDAFLDHINLGAAQRYELHEDIKNLQAVLESVKRELLNG